jgi:hypothetical protein
MSIFSEITNLVIMDEQICQRTYELSFLRRKCVSLGTRPFSNPAPFLHYPKGNSVLKMPKSYRRAKLEPG